MNSISFVEKNRYFPIKSTSSRLFLSADDDDEDEEDDDTEQKGPLSNGIDSVSWLPSVSGARGDNMPITSAKEVRFVNKLVDIV
jgi:hypothetical protein